jgi:hypothetical protein
MVENRFPFGDSFGHPVDRLVSMILGKRTTTPFEEACEIVADLEILLARLLSIYIESDKQLVKRFPGKRPPLARCGLNMVLPVEHSSVRLE